MSDILVGGLGSNNEITQGFPTNSPINLSGVQPLIDTADIYEHLAGLDAWLDAAANSRGKFDDTKIRSRIVQWTRKFERTYQFRINPVQMVGAPDGSYSAPPGGELVVEQGYTYYHDYMNNEFGAMTLRERPVYTIDGVPQLQRMRLILNGQIMIYQIPQQWICVDPRSSRIWLEPWSGTAVIGQATAMLAAYNATFSDALPNFIFVDYMAGLPNGWQSTTEWSDVPIILAQFCALEVLERIGQAIDPGLTGRSFSADGLSSQRSYDRFQQRKSELRDAVQAWSDTLVSQETAIPFTTL